LVAGFTDPTSSGIGGGGFALSGRRATKSRSSSIFGKRRPAPSTRPCSNTARAAEKRGQTVGVPGEVAGLFELAPAFRQARWRDIVMRASALSARGFAAEPHTVVQVAEHQQELLAAPPFPQRVPSGWQRHEARRSVALTRLRENARAHRRRG
jgi:gamma-glutamyltranspeptidase/glutathione hydrolase/leukotriene-C4 hydrolase